MIHLLNYFILHITYFIPLLRCLIQLDFMRTLYNVLKSSNIKFGERNKPVYEIIKKNKNLQKILKHEIRKDFQFLNDNIDIETNQTDKDTDAEDGDEHQNHIICEMKTGSGKSLSLLTPLIYWLLKNKFDLFLLRENTQLKKEEPEWIKESVSMKLLEKYAHNLKIQEKRKEADAKILNKYFSISNDKITLKENIKIEKKTIHLDPSKAIHDHFGAEKDEEVLSDFSIEGSSKKQIFICSRTQSQLNQYFLELKKIEKNLGKELSINMIIIGSRKHLCVNETFLKKYRSVNELNDCCRNSECRYKEIFKKNMMLKKKKREKKKNKIFYISTSSSSGRSTKGNSSSSSSSSEGNMKEVDAVDNYTLTTKLINSKNLNMNQVKEICRNDRIEICPYYLSKENVKNADIVLLPYVCILNEHVRKSLKIDIKNNIVIFDESQNIIDSINDANSVSIEYHHILFCMLILKEYIKKYEHVLNNSNMVMIKQIVIYCDLMLHSFVDVKDNLMKVTKYIFTSKLDALNLNNISNFLNSSHFCRRIKIFAESYIRQKFTTHPTGTTIRSLNTSSIYLLNDFTNKMIRSNRYDYIFLNRGGGTSNIGEEANPWATADAAKPDEQANSDRNRKNKRSCDDKQEVSNVEEKKRMKDGSRKMCDGNTKKCMLEESGKRNSYQNDPVEERIKILMDDLTRRDREELFHKIELVSVSSCNNFQKITKDCSNVILIGGTLQPIEEFLLLFINEREEKKKVKLFLSDYIFKKQNVFSRIVSTSIVSFEPIDNTFKNRFKKTHLLNLAIQIFFLTLHVSYGNIVFFSSYNFLNEFISFLHNEGQYVLKQIKQKKHIFFEKKNNTNQDDILTQYMQTVQHIKNQNEKLRIKNGCILFCVMNAKLSEGINFYDYFCRNLLVVGIPFAKSENRGAAGAESNHGTSQLNKNMLLLNYYKVYSTHMTDCHAPSSPESNIHNQISNMCKTYELQLAMKIVNQCIGRSLRHIEDYSSFFFLDYRFCNREFLNLFPSFIRTHLDASKDGKSPFKEQEESDFFIEKNNFNKIYNDIKHHYSSTFPEIHFEKTNETHLNNFSRDIYLLRKFHNRMDSNNRE
ncbi:DEAD box helicase [Plasmodium gonderi]|uniref:DEAD box helicase n=1 Tax=Plasmodium gonderi TaxID=77519 RepID=A0A1Y1JL09_PLAGO|nr:DEAD box helicase [Plasmodium gonderi]GAW82318.1 DEAD box helicase [Plasmodium gonderi]